MRILIFDLCIIVSKIVCELRFTKPPSVIPFQWFISNRVAPKPKAQYDNVEINERIAQFRSYGGGSSTVGMHFLA